MKVRAEIKIIDIETETIRDFKDSWPCNNIPENVDFICVAFAGEDLLDYDAEDAQGGAVEIPQDGQQALAALFHDALENYRELPHIPGSVGRQLTY